MSAPSGRRGLLVSFLVVALTLGTAEVVVRLLGPSLGVDRRELENLRHYGAADNNRFRPVPYVGYALRDPEHESEPPLPTGWPYAPEKEPGTLRIACLGGSTTASGYPRSLDTILNQEHGLRVEVQNWGVPGWTTAETLVNYVLNVRHHEPDVVVIHHAVNDSAPRMRAGFRTDYSHYRRPWSPPARSPLLGTLIARSDLVAALVLRGGARGFQLADFVDAQDTPTVEVSPETTVAFERNVRTLGEIVRGHGGRVALMTVATDLRIVDQRGNANWIRCVDEHNEILRRIAAEEGYLLVDFAAFVRQNAETVGTTFKPGDIAHMTPKGRRQRAEYLAEALLASDLLEPR